MMVVNVYESVSIIAIGIFIRLCPIRNEVTKWV